MIEAVSQHCLENDILIGEQLRCVDSIPIQVQEASPLSLFERFLKKSETILKKAQRTNFL